MNAPAEIHRRSRAGVDDDARESIVAKGPLVIMAHGLLSIAPGERSQCWIRSSAGDLSAEDAEQALRLWSRNPPN